MLAILLGGHFQMRELYLGVRGSSDKKTSISHLCSNFSHLTESLSHNSINWHFLKVNYFKETWSKLNERKEKPSEWSTFSKFSHFSKESHRKWVRFPLFSHVHVRQNFLEHLWNSFERLWTFFVLLLDPYKKSWHSQDQNVMLINFKKLVDSIHLHSLVSFNSIYFPVSNTRWQKFSTLKLCTMSPMLRNTMASRNTFSFRTETKILNLYMKVILLSHFRSI